MSLEFKGEKGPSWVGCGCQKEGKGGAEEVDYAGLVAVLCIISWTYGVLDFFEPSTETFPGIGSWSTVHVRLPRM